ALGQQRILSEPAGIDALHIAHQILHVAGNLRVVTQVFAQSGKIPYGFAIAPFKGRRIAVPGAIPALAPVPAVIATRRPSTERAGLAIVSARRAGALAGLLSARRLAALRGLTLTFLLALTLLSGLSLLPRLLARLLTLLAALARLALARLLAFLAPQAA